MRNLTVLQPQGDFRYAPKQKQNPTLVTGPFGPAVIEHFAVLQNQKRVTNSMLGAGPFGPAFNETAMLC